MSQWQSQTRRMNRHYQSTKQAPVYFWGLSFNAFGIQGITINDKTAYLPQVLYEPGSTKNPTTINYFNFGSITFDVTNKSLYAGGHYVTTVSDTEYDIYVGIYTPDEYELIAEPSSIAASGTFRQETTTIKDDKIVENEDWETISYASIDTAMIPSLIRYPVIIYSKLTAEILPETFSFFADYPDKGELPYTLTISPLINDTTLANSFLGNRPQIQEQFLFVNELIPTPKIVLPGTAPVRCTSITAVGGGIAGCDFRAYNNGTFSNDKITNFNGDAYSSYYSSTDRSIRSICFGQYSSGLNNPTSNAYQYTNTRGIDYSLSQCDVQAGGGITQTGIPGNIGVPRNAGSTISQNPYTLIGTEGPYAYCGFVRKITGIRIVDDFQFFA